MSQKPVKPHGGDIYGATEEYGWDRNEILDYSANINPLGVPEELKELIISSLDGLVHYPDTECRALKKAISAYMKVPEECIIVGNGETEIIFLLFEVLQPSKVLIPAPTFSEYAEAARRYGAEITYFELKQEDGFRLDFTKLIEQFEEGVDAVVLCNPNNPTSTLIPKKELEKLIRSARDKNVKVVIDEAFIELTEGDNSNSTADLVGEYENLFILRAFTKIFAIPGLRLGYGIGDFSLVKRMWDKKLPWSVNSMASCVGEYLGNSREYLKASAMWLKAEKSPFVSELCRIHGIQVFLPEANFILLKLTDERLTSEKLCGEMAKRGVLIRDASNFKYLDDSFVRIAIKDRESNSRFIKTLREVVERDD